MFRIFVYCLIFLEFQMHDLLMYILVYCLSYVIYVSTNSGTISKITFPSLNPLCSCGSSIESTSLLLLHCFIFNANRQTILTIINLTQTLLFSNTSFDTETNTLIPNATIDYILFSKRYEEIFFLEKKPLLSYVVL